MSTETLKIGIVASALTENVREAPRLARMHGFDGLLFDAFAPGLSLPDLSASGRREFRHLLSAEDRQFAGLRVDLGAKGLAPGADVDRLIAQLDRAMEAAAGLGSPLLCVEAGPLPAPPRQSMPRPKVTPEQAGLIILPTFAAAPDKGATDLEEMPVKVDPNFVAQVDGALAEIGRRADRYGVTVALRSELSSLAAAERALRTAGCPWFGVDLDPVAILRDEWDVDETFGRLGTQIRHVRGRDAVRGADCRTKPAIAGQGSTDWRQFLTNLDQSGYHGWITLDPADLPARTAAAVVGLEHLRRSR